jgi:hypothetical protein
VIAGVVGGDDVGGGVVAGGNDANDGVVIGATLGAEAQAATRRPTTIVVTTRESEERIRMSSRWCLG